jgi:hypothetical protein
MCRYVANMHTASHMPTYSGSSVSAVNPNANEIFLTVTKLFYILQQNIT